MGLSSVVVMITLVSLLLLSPMKSEERWTDLMNIRPKNAALNLDVVSFSIAFLLTQIIPSLR